MDFAAMFMKVCTKNGLVFSFMLIGIITLITYKLSGLTKGKVHGSAIAIFAGLVLAYIGGITTGGSKGLASIPMFAGVGMMGGGMFRDFAIVSTAFGADLREIKKCGVVGVVSLLMGVLSSFVVGPVTGAALGASSDVIAISIAAGVVKSVLVMIVTPFVKNMVGLDNPQSAMIYGGLMGTSSGVAAGLAAVDAKLVPYGAMTATFYTGTGCLLCPSVLYLATKAIMG